MKTDEFDYSLPLELIAQTPLGERDQSRLMLVDRRSGRVSHHIFQDILNFFHPGDIVVANNSRVIPARLFGQKITGGRVELLLLEKLAQGHWLALVGGRRLREGVQIRLEDAQGQPTEFMAMVAAAHEGAQREIIFTPPIEEHLARLGHMPLPPYIHETLTDPERYQTVYAQPPGSAAAPTAGLHFTPELLLALREKGVLFETCTLHVGLDTFQPVAEEDATRHKIHSEWVQLGVAAAERINRAKLAGGRLIAIGTTAMRTLETAAQRSSGRTGSLQTVSQDGAAVCPWRPVMAVEGPTDLYIYPGYRFLAVDGLVTNFHLPRSTLLMLVSAFAGSDLIRQAYQAAIQERYRFFSFGDAMFII
ncbi:MAG: tRNA preQ1(34) S-adenosylmethionine ribosyltransferase-isomerase QueA [Anaerolineae bacterium]|nr:tRNA preQ1(34) S-adenosylmethionine ribosyltransferase-isomerase QueA [Anaerolineae bacterium]